MTKNHAVNIICRAYSDGVINSKQLHELAARLEKHKPFWRVDKFGFPIDTFKGAPIRSVVRIVLQNIRKMTG